MHASQQHVSDMLYMHHTAPGLMDIIDAPYPPGLMIGMDTPHPPGLMIGMDIPYPPGAEKHHG
jgi:hypothetical protein